MGEANSPHQPLIGDGPMIDDDELEGMSVRPAPTALAYCYPREEFLNFKSDFM